MLKLLI